MAFTLVVQPGWRAHVQRVWTSLPGIVPVVKGNGYGFGRQRLAHRSLALGADEIAVGTVHELTDLPGGVTPIVLTPCLPGEVVASGPGAAVFTVGSPSDVAALPGGARVILKIESSMRRYGVPASEVVALAGEAARTGLSVHGFSIHLPLGQTAEVGLAEAAEAVRVVPDGASLYVSHLSAEANAALAAMRPTVRIRPRVGTALWLGDKQHVALVADVAAVRSVRAGEPAGYRLRPVDGDGHLVMITAGTANGVQPLEDGRSPFHFARTRLLLHEGPHMHTSMCWVPLGDPCPAVGDQVDVQQPITRVWPDRVRFT